MLAGFFQPPFARLVALALTFAAAAITVEAQQPPLIVSPGVAISPGPTLTTVTPTFTWYVLPGATGYGLYITDLTGNIIVYPNSAGTTTTPLTGTSFTLPDGYLVPGNAYSWTMTSFTGPFQSMPSAPFYFETAAAGLSAPTVNLASSVTTSAFDANWSSVTNATGYRMDVSSSRTFSSFVNGWEDQNVGNVTSVTVNKLNSYTYYYYRLRAYDATLLSTNSTTNSVVTLLSSLAAPTALAATSVSTNSFVANWTKVALAISYRIDISTTNTFATFIPGGEDLNAGNATSILISNLALQTVYYYRVRAVNVAGTSLKSATISVTTLATPPPAPVAQPASAITSAGFTANWQAVSLVSGYQVDVSANSSFANYVAGWTNRAVGNVLSANVTGLSAGTVYYYRVRANDAGNVSANSASISVQTLPPILIATPRGTNLVLTWPTNDAAFKLFYATNLPATAWISNPAIPSIVLGQLTITNHFTNSAQFYRLKN